ncbi:MAG: hypothetical protein ABUK13_04535 [Gammaproteobacteria bacterium]
MLAKAYKKDKVLEFNDSQDARDALAKFGYTFKAPKKPTKKAE